MNRFASFIAVLFLLIVGSGGIASAQHEHDGADVGQMEHSGVMSGKGDLRNMMQQMMKEPHHKLAMAYKDTLVTFAAALKSEVSGTGKVDKSFAETAVEELRRSLTQMQKHHGEHMKMMPAEMRQQMGEDMKMMENRLSTLRQHVDLLEKEVKREYPEPKKVVAEADQILEQCKMMKSHMEMKMQK